MKTILSIGYAHFVLPPSANVNAVIAVLSKARLVDREFENGRHVYRPIRDRDPKVTVTIVHDSDILERKAISEKASPDANNTF